jgi:hypothetical protein
MRVMRTLLALSLLEVGQPMPDANATTLVLIKTESIARAADRVVHGAVIATESRWDRDRIVTRVRLRPASGEPDVWFEHPGGTVGDVTMKVLGMPEFRPGEHALVFLAARHGRLRLVGLSEGKLSIVARDGHDVVYVRLRDNGPLEPMALDQVLARLTPNR